MSKASFIPDLIPYNEMHRILREKFNVTHDELRFWIKISLDFIKSNKFIDCADTIISMDDCFDNGLYLLFPPLSLRATKRYFPAFKFSNLKVLKLSKVLVMYRGLCL